MSVTDMALSILVDVPSIFEDNWAWTDFLDEMKKLRVECGPDETDNINFIDIMIERAKAVLSSRGVTEK